MSDDKVSKAASKLSKLGAAKGGKARASVLSPEERKEIGRNAVGARWKKAKGEGYSLPAPQQTEPVIAQGTQTPPPEGPHSLFQGKVMLGDLQLEAHVLNDFRRVFTQREVVKAISGGRESGALLAYTERNPLIDNSYVAGAVIQFKIPGNPTPANGYEATLLIDICDKYLQAREKKLLKSSQLHLAKQAEIITRACAKIGIIALIDEATGYQKFRAKRSLQIKLQAFIAEEMQEWARMFPEEFWLEIARMEGIHYSPRHRPLRWGKYVMAFVYDAIDKDVGKKLREINPDPHFRTNHHQWLKDFGRDKVNNHLQRVIAVMKLCTNMTDFQGKFAKVFSRDYQYSFDDVDWGMQT